MRLLLAFLLLLPPAPAPLPLAGYTVVVDAGHQLGNARHPAQIGRLVPDGRGGRKPCNTVGTATRGGYPEATFAWGVATRLRTRLERLGARVVMTRTSNSARRWGPCVDVRGRAGNAIDADLKISIHGDGSYAPGSHGFHVIRTPGSSPRLSYAVRSSLRAVGRPTSSYAGRAGLDVRGDLATLNWSRMPSVMVELGNMRDPREGAYMASPGGQAAYARGLAGAVRAYLG